MLSIIAIIVLQYISGQHVKNQVEICKTFFKLLENERDTWLCECGRKLKQRKGTGWSNLYAHIKVQHQQKSETVVNNLHDQPTLSHPIYGIVSKKSSKFVWLVGLGVYGTQAIRVRRERSYKKIYQLATNLSKSFDEIHALDEIRSREDYHQDRCDRHFSLFRFKSARLVHNHVLFLLLFMLFIFFC